MCFHFGVYCHSMFIFPLNSCVLFVDVWHRAGHNFIVKILFGVFFSAFIPYKVGHCRVVYFIWTQIVKMAKINICALNMETNGVCNRQPAPSTIEENHTNNKPTLQPLERRKKAHAQKAFYVNLVYYQFVLDSNLQLENLFPLETIK